MTGFNRACKDVAWGGKGPRSNKTSMLRNDNPIPCNYTVLVSDKSDPNAIRIEQRRFTHTFGHWVGCTLFATLNFLTSILIASPFTRSLRPFSVNFKAPINPMNAREVNKPFLHKCSTFCVIMCPCPGLTSEPWWKLLYSLMLDESFSKDVWFHSNSQNSRFFKR